MHIVLATMPQEQEQEFNDSIVKEFYGNYRKSSSKYLADVNKGDYWKANAESEVDVLYNPLRYYILGNYDIAYISMIDNFKFAQRVFEPQLSSNESSAPPLFSPHTFQSFTGLTLHSGADLRNFFNEKLTDNKRYFLSITNLKLNNGFLIGNGNLFLNNVVEQIHKIVDKVNKEIGDKRKPAEILLMQSFSWFELSLSIFADDPADIALILKNLRRLAVQDLSDRRPIVQNSYFKTVFTDEYVYEEIIKANVFADTHTYFGVHADLVEEAEELEFVKDFYEKNIQLKTEIEWQVKPGHMSMLVNCLKEYSEGIFDYTEHFILAGKSDYYIHKANPSFNDNIKLFRLIFAHRNELYKHVRKIRTKIKFSEVDIAEKTDTDRKILDFQSKLVTNGVKISAFSELDKKLKSLKISRQIRSKILKIFSNYNNGIQDIILFPFFLDFKIFIDHLTEMINASSKQLSRRFEENSVFSPELDVEALETNLMHLIMIFQEGYNIRMLNGYQFEDINDFDLDFNSSIQQLLSVYSTIAIEFGNLFYKKPYTYGPIVQLNLKDTVSNYSSINYYIHHLTSPEFVFSTLTKEILNLLYIDDTGLRDVYDDYHNKIKVFDIESKVLQDFIENDLFSIEYFINDAIRFIVTYDMDFELFHYWFWTYNLQNAGLYDKIGTLNEDHFKKELFRVLFLNQFFGFDSKLITCPLPELYTFWDRHFIKTKQAVKEFNDFFQNEAILKNGILDYLLTKFDTSLSVLFEDTKFTNRNISRAAEFLKKFVSTKGSKSPANLLDNVGKRIAAYELLDAGDSSNLIPTDSLLHIQWFMLSKLREIAALNNSKTILLRRDWFTGKPMRSFAMGGDMSHIYAVDQTGGLFFDSTESMNKYFKLTAYTLSHIWDFSLKRKKKFMTYSNLS